MAMGGRKASSSRAARHGGRLTSGSGNRTVPSRWRPLAELFAQTRTPVPGALGDWEERVGTWCEEYLTRHPTGELSEITLAPAVFIFDHSAERVVLAYALSVPQLLARDQGRMRGFPDVNATVRRVLGDKAFLADRGHFLGHASGGELDINLFPQRRELNRGWSAEGKLFRRMEHYVAEHLGSFFYHRPDYDDDTWIPLCLEYGILLPDTSWWAARFRNK